MYRVKLYLFTRAPLLATITKIDAFSPWITGLNNCVPTKDPTPIPVMRVVATGMKNPFSTWCIVPTTPLSARTGSSNNITLSKSRRHGSPRFTVNVRVKNVALSLGQLNPATGYKEFSARV